MLILDTNVFSEFMRPNPERRLLHWAGEVDPATRYTTATTVAEVRYGIERMSDGRRKEELRVRAGAGISAFGDRVLPFDVAAAEHFAEAASRRARLGRPISVPDAQIAAICRVHGATLATRNVRDFEGLDLALVNPWEA